jgi:hypothetical protein
VTSMDDEVLECVSCRSLFTFTGSEHRFYLEKGFVLPDGSCMKPIRCDT